MPHLNVPRPLTKALKTKLVCDLRGIHGIGQILLIGKNQKEGITELILVEHPLQLFPCLGDTLPIVRVNDENDTLSVLEVYKK